MHLNIFSNIIKSMESEKWPKITSEDVQKIKSAEENAPVNPTNNDDSNKKEAGETRKIFFEFFKFCLIAAIVVVPIRLWVAQPFLVNGSSMSPSFENGEYLIVDEFSYHFHEPQRGEVIIFRYPYDPSKFFIKRIIGLPREKLEIKNGKTMIFNETFLEGITLEEGYVIHNENYIMNDLSIDLGPSEYFVMGDNRPMSSDSRTWGTLNRDFIVGRAWIRLWPFQKANIYF